MITLKSTLLIKALRFQLDQNGEIVPGHTLMTVPAICQVLRLTRAQVSYQLDLITGRRQRQGGRNQ